MKLLIPKYTVASKQNTTILVQFSLYVHNGSLKPYSFLFFYKTQLLLFSLTLDYKLLSCVQLGLILPGKMDLVQFSLYMHNGSLKPHSFLFYETQLLLFSLTIHYKLLSCVQLGLILTGKLDLRSRPFYEL